MDAAKALPSCRACTPAHKGAVRESSVTRPVAPKSDELEISVIEPGLGECVLLHVGHNEWCIVDSCTAAGSTESVALEYLNSFNNGAVDGVKLIVATHWHDDHIRGLSSILRRVPTALFFCSAALSSENFIELVSTAASGIGRRSGAEEFATILGMIETFSKPTPKRLASPKWAVENLPLLDLPGAGRSFPVVVTALSPSHGTVKTAFMQFAQMLPKAGDIQKRIPNRSLNHNSVVLWVEAGNQAALLGADLQHTVQAGEGWTAAIACHGGLGGHSAEFFKVPHHGSPNAENPDVWKRILIADPISVVTPFTAGRVRLPRDQDLHRLNGHTTRLYCTSMGAGRSPARDNVVEKMMRERVTERRVMEGKPGHVRVRWSPNSHGTVPVVETFNGAYQVKG